MGTARPSVWAVLRSVEPCVDDKYEEGPPEFSSYGPSAGGHILGENPTAPEAIVSEMRRPRNSLLVRRLAHSPSVVHADQDGGRCRVRVEGATSRADTRAECEMIIVAQVHVVAFEEGRPTRRE